MTPQDGDPAAGVCSGFATADLFAVKFFPGLDEAVIQDLRYVDFDLLASAEWTGMTGAGQ